VAALAIPLALLIFNELGATRLERRLVDDGRDRDIDPLVARRRNAGDRV